MSILTAFSQMLIFFSLIMVGVACSRKNLVNEENAHSISKLIVNVFNPAIIFSSVLGNSQNKEGDFISLIVLIAIIMFSTFIILGSIGSRFFTKDKDEIKIYKLMTVFSNVGFIGIPLVDSLYGSSAIIYVAIFILIYNILIYTYGISILQGEAGKRLSLTNLKNILNMGTLSCCITLFVFCFHISIHPVVQTTVTYLGNVATPLSMMSIGFSLGRANIFSVFNDKKLYLFSFIKLIIIPVIGVLILKRFNLPEQVLGVSAVMLSMPIGNLPVMLANQYGVNSENCAKGIIITTLFSVITVPLIMGLV
ncbi:AEC family transporter [[Clostridium] fimetarium]|uniref:Membrane transport protein n=1 Tax=[Clostridium] fimetarium TaxID=99656 RepID=A0A1I0MX04_9FIRM|nr:AEC family transporter [[Clostridium] fimetarium]SEV92591.1 hypothetical protein SAMN05421659_102171 [[Clostridium] fimetarium]